MEETTAGRGGESGREAVWWRAREWVEGARGVLYSIETQGIGNGRGLSDHHGSNAGRIGPSVYIILIDYSVSRLLIDFSRPVIRHISVGITHLLDFWSLSYHVPVDYDHHQFHRSIVIVSFRLLPI